MPLKNDKNLEKYLLLKACRSQKKQRIVKRISIMKDKDVKGGLKFF